jgi:hypothetical protein
VARKPPPAQTPSAGFTRPGTAAPVVLFAALSQVGFVLDLVLLLVTRVSEQKPICVLKVYLLRAL